MNENNEQKEAERLRKKQEQAAREKQKKMEKLEKGKTPPSEIFKSGSAAKEYSQYDEKVSSSFYISTFFEPLWSFSPSSGHPHPRQRRQRIVEIQKKEARKGVCSTRKTAWWISRFRCSGRRTLFLIAFWGKKKKKIDLLRTNFYFSSSISTPSFRFSWWAWDIFECKSLKTKQSCFPCRKSEDI